LLSRNISSAALLAWSGSCRVRKMIMSVYKMLIAEANRSFKNAQDAQDAHVLGMSILILCPVSNSSVQKATEAL